MVLLFDGDCRLCTRAASRLRRWAAPGAVECVSFREPGVLERFPRVSAADCERSIQLVLADGGVVSGAEAVFRALATRGIFRPLLWAYLLPGVREAVDGAYRLLARNRMRFGGAAACTTGECARKE
jgi:predicted DCC family thiol-disulfide oxidoreductase YuxK